MKTEKSSRAKSISSQKVYIFIFVLFVFVLIIACLYVKLWMQLSNIGSKVIDKNNDTFLVVLIGIAGFLAAFSTINIFSFFNANIDREKEFIANMKENLELEIEKLKENIKKEFEQVKENNSIEMKKMLESRNKSEMDLNRITTITSRIVDLTSPYSTSLKKREAIKDFTNLTNIDQETMKFFLNYFLSLGDEESNKNYYVDLKNLLGQWGVLKN